MIYQLLTENKEADKITLHTASIISGKIASECN